MNQLEKQIFADFEIDFNQTSIDELFQKYEEIGFIYPKKKALLAPYFDQIRKNWERLLTGENDLLWILCKTQEQKGHFASISVWKQSNYGVIAQHLVSNGNPFLSLKVMLAAQFKAEYHCGAHEIQSSQNWFRPENRYAYRVFASMYDKLGPEKASLITFHYLHLPLSQVVAEEQDHLAMEEVTGVDPEFMAFIRRQHGDVFLRAEELDREDIRLTHIGDLYCRAGLERSRKVLKITDSRTGQIIGGIIANRAPLGLNFSFLENRCHYVLEKQLDRRRRLSVLQKMHAAAQPVYQEFPLRAIPIVTDAFTARLLRKQGAVFFREYMQSIWLREGFPEWYDHVESFLRRIERRYSAA